MRSLLLFPALVMMSFGIKAQAPAFEGADFSEADSVAQHYAHYSLKDPKDLALKLTSPLPTDVEKFRAIYRWVCDNIESDYALCETVLSKRARLSPAAFEEWNHVIKGRFFKALINDHRTICTGYAYLVRQLSLLSGIPCVIVNGYGRTSVDQGASYAYPNHSWNAVMLNKHWYLCDATWSSGAVDGGTGIFYHEFTDAYFLAAPEMFIRNHYPLDTTWTLLKKNPSLEEFERGPLLYKGAYRYHLLPEAPRTFEVDAVKGEPVAFSLSVSDCAPAHDLEVQIVKGNTEIKTYPDVYQVTDHTFNFTQVFSNRGRYVVHLLMKSDYVCTYLVRVE